MTKIYVNFDSPEPGVIIPTVILNREEELEPLLKKNKVEVYFEDKFATGAKVLYVRSIKKNASRKDS